MVAQDSGWWFLKTMVRKGRIDAGKSQREIGDEVDRSKDTILEWEKGRTDIPLQAIKALAEACGLSDEISGYMRSVARARKRGAAIEADMRYNALFLALAEEYCKNIFKFDALLIPGPLQTRTYHYLVARLAEPGSDEWVDSGWRFKSERGQVLFNRTDRPIIQFVIGETALFQLRQISEEVYQEQMAHLRKWAKRPGVSIRILRTPVPTYRSGFEIYKPGDSALACPPFVYTEIADSSWCIDVPGRITRYDEIRKMLWKMAIRIEDYHDDDRRDRLA